MKMKSIHRWSVGAALVVSFTLGGAFGRDQGLFGPALAAWFQAFGGLAAIAATWLIGQRQLAASKDQLDAQITTSRELLQLELEAQSAQREADQRGRQKAGLVILLEAISRFRIANRTLVKRSPDPELMTAVAVTLRSATAHIDRFPLQELGEPEPISWILEISGTMELTVQQFVAAGRLNPGSNFSSAASTAIQSLGETVRGCEYRLQLYASHYGLAVPESKTITI